MSKVLTCEWIEDNTRCCRPAKNRKPYCEVHHNRAYMTLQPEMADYLLEKEIQSSIKSSPNTLPKH